MAVFRPFKLQEESETEISDCKKPSFYIYKQSVGDFSQIGIVGCISIDEYGEEKIKKHEHTRVDKVDAITEEYDRIGFIREPIFLTYFKENDNLVNFTKDFAAKHKFVYSGIDKKGVLNTYWAVTEEKDIHKIEAEMSKIHALYIADGHHRCASAYNVGMLRRERKGTYSGDEDFNFVLSAVFPHDQLMLMEFNRGIHDLNGYTEESLIEAIKSQGFELTYLIGKPAKPSKKHEMVMVLESGAYVVTPSVYMDEDDVVNSLDAAILQNYILEPVFGIADPRKDKRLEFIGGSCGTEELIERVGRDLKVGFLLYPVSIEEVFAVADNNKVMPPKSTWFEPKMATDLFIRKI